MADPTRRCVLAGVAATLALGSGCLGSGGRSVTTLRPDSSGPATTVDGTVYFGTTEDLYAIDTESQETIWTYHGTTDEIDFRPSVADGTVYVSENFDGGVHAVSGGGRDWRFDDYTNQPSRPVPSGDAVYVTAGGTLYELDRADGTVRRTRSLDTLLPATPVVRADALYVLVGERLWGIDRATLDAAWTHPVAERSGLAVRGDALLVSSTRHGGLVALDRRDGSLAWETELGHVSRVTTTDDGFYAVEQTGEQGRLGAYEAGGIKRWVTPNARITIGPAADSEAVYGVSRALEELRAFDATTGEKQWTAGIDAGSFRGPPAIAPGHVYVPTTAGLVAVET